MKKQTTKKVILTEKQESFAIAYTLNGGNASEAYREAYNVDKETKETSIWVNAHKALHHAKVSQRVAELRLLKLSTNILSIDERKRLLSEWALAGDPKSVDMLNKMDGVYVEKQEVILAGHITMLPAKDKDN